MRIAAVILPGALAAAVWLATADGAEVPWLGLGAAFEADGTGRVFLALTAVVWTLAGLASGPVLRDPAVRRGRTAAFAAVGLVGNLGVAVAQDVVSFYACFSAMSLAAYGLVVARSDAVARRAGRVYIAMAVAAEAALLAGLVLAVRSAGALGLDDVRAALAQAPERDLVIGLLLAGFGVKAGALGLHLWLPLAYTAAPLPLAAVLAGSMTEVGVLGWLRVLPIGSAPLGGWGALLVVVGLAAVVHGTLVGVTQAHGAAVLAYSSIGQIGLMAAGVGIALARPELAPAAVAAVLVLCLHHGIVKGTLFLALGVAAAARPGRPRAAARAAIALLALALAGAPLTSGGVAKEALKTPGQAWWGGMDVALALAAAGTAVLMWRLLRWVWWLRPEAERLPGAASGAALASGVVATALLPLVAASWSPLAAAATAAPSVGSAWAAIWPLAAGVAAAWALGRLAAGRPGARVRIPTGDVVVAAARAGEAARDGAMAIAGPVARRRDRVRARADRVLDARPLWRAIEGLEARAATLTTGALALAALVLALAAVVVR